MIRTFHIEVRFDGTVASDFKQFLVDAKTYEEACGVASKHCPDGQWKLLGVYEKMETEKKMKKRIS